MGRQRKWVKLKISCLRFTSKRLGAIAWQMKLAEADRQPSREDEGQEERGDVLTKEGRLNMQA